MVVEEDEVEAHDCAVERELSEGELHEHEQGDSEVVEDAEARVLRPSECEEQQAV